MCIETKKMIVDLRHLAIVLEKRNQTEVTHKDLEEVRSALLPVVDGLQGVIVSNNEMDWDAMCHSLIPLDEPR